MRFIMRLMGRFRRREGLPGVEPAVRQGRVRFRRYEVERLFRADEDEW